MKVKEIISSIRNNTPWVNYAKTRDILITGDENMDISGIGVCWVATNKAIKQAISEGINMVFTHENPFYVENTAIPRCILEKRREKLKQCIDNNIAIYRLHDGWDQFPEYGVCDRLAKITGFKFEERKVKEDHQKALLNSEYSVEEIAKKIAQGLSPYGSDHVEVFGDINKKVNVLTIGVGAATYSSLMYETGSDCMVLCYDGSTAWIDHQWALDTDIPLILVQHYVNVIPGVLGMKEYMENNFKNYKVIKLDEGYKYTSFKAESIKNKD